jgi:hypothetical protein
MYRTTRIIREIGDALAARASARVRPPGAEPRPIPDEPIRSGDRLPRPARDGPRETTPRSRA